MNCSFCNLPLTGRADKRFHRNCKVKYHNLQRKSWVEFKAKYLEPIDFNYRILVELLDGHEEARVTRQQLAERGFYFNCLTGFYYVGDTIKYCIYDLSFMIRGEERKVFIERNDVELEPKDNN